MAEHLWMRQAECRGKVDGMWDESTPSPEALRVCFRCPVRRECAEYGLARHTTADAGVLGGLGLYDRDRVRDGKVTLEEAWDRRLRELVEHDAERAQDEQFVRDMPRLELV